MSAKKKKTNNESVRDEMLEIKMRASLKEDEIVFDGFDGYLESCLGNPVGKRAWTDREKAIIVRYYGRGGVRPEDIAKALGRRVCTVRDIAAVLRGDGHDVACYALPTKKINEAEETESLGQSKEPGAGTKQNR